VKKPSNENAGPEIILTWPEICKVMKIVHRIRSTAVVVILCPFHREKTPSLHMWPGSGRFHCHGCGAEGDKDKFLSYFPVELQRSLALNLHKHRELDRRQMLLNL